MGKYAAQGTGLSDPATRKRIYTVAIVIGAIALAVLITSGIISRDQVTAFIDVLGWSVGIIIGAVSIVVAGLARRNVDPPTE